ncbi:PEP-CTERM sorting domain-containing protein [Desulfomicrobium salsuginis]
MNKKSIFQSILMSCAILLSTSLAFAGTVYWTDWTSVTTGDPGVLGTLDPGSGAINVAFSGVYSFAQTGGIGDTNYWNPSTPYISAVVGNAPPASDIIALGTGGTVNITFSEAVLDPLIALVSWNGNTVDFGVPIEILSYGQGYWGSGTPILNVDEDGFFGDSEVHGVIRLPGTYSAISFTHTSEGWHGFTVGVVGAGEQPPTVPEPSTMLLLGLGLLAVAGMRRKLG